MADYAYRTVELGYSGGVALISSALGASLAYETGALIFGVGLTIVAALDFWTDVSHTPLLLLAFVLTRPLGAALGAIQDKAVPQEGLTLSCLYASGALGVFLAVCLRMVRQQPAQERATAWRDGRGRAARA